MWHHDGDDVDRLADSFKQWLEMATLSEANDDDRDDEDDDEAPHPPAPSIYPVDSFELFERLRMLMLPSCLQRIGDAATQIVFAP